MIAITDSHHSPIAASADCVLKAHSNMVSFVDSMVGPLSLLNALVVALSMSRQDEVKANLENLENIWKEFDVPFTAMMADHRETRSLIFFSFVILNFHEAPVHLTGFSRSRTVAVGTITLWSSNYTFYRDK